MGRYNRDLTSDAIDKCNKDTIAFYEDNCVSTALDFCLTLGGEEKKNKYKIVEFNFHLHAHNGSEFDTWIILDNLDCDRHIVNIIKNVKGFIESKVFNRYIEKKNKLLNIFIFAVV